MRTGPTEIPTMEILVNLRREYLQLIWNKIPFEIEGLHYLNLTQGTVWNVARTHEMDLPLTQGEVRRVQEGQSKEEITKERF